MKNLSVWKTISLGNFKNVDEIFKAFIRDGLKMDECASNILRSPQFVISSTKIEIQLVCVSVFDLGFEEGASYQNICDKAKEFRLEPCPSEVGPQLRLQYKDQPFGEWLRVAMEPISDTEGNFHIFDIENDDEELFLYSYCGHPDCFWGGNYYFVFKKF
jgi:hypothetical protein